MRARMLSHKRVQRYWPTQVWAATLLLSCTQTWWAMFGLRNRHDWKFEQFAVLLAQTVLLYLIAGLVYPDFGEEKMIDLRGHYFQQRKRFFGLFIFAALVSIYRDIVLNHTLPDRANLSFHGLFIVTASIAVFTANEWYHKLLAVFSGGTFLFYISSLFTRLH